MASMREIKRRRGSIQSTQQITKAMKLVSTVKLQRARQQAEQAKAYFHGMYDTIHSILAQTGDVDSPYLKQQTDGKIGIVVVTSNRGAGRWVSCQLNPSGGGSKRAKREIATVYCGTERTGSFPIQRV